jgi:nicotinamidase-related amidase
MKKFLIVVDMQKDFIDGSLGTVEAQAIVPRVKLRIMTADPDELIFFTQDTHYDDYLDTPEGKKLPIEHCVLGTNGWQVPEELTEAVPYTATMIPKNTFGSLELMEEIFDLVGIDEEMEIELCGLCTDICVVSNALLAKAYFPDAKIIVNSQLCAGVTPEAHEAALITMKACQIDVI